MKKNIITISLAALTVFVSLTSCERNLDQISSVNEAEEQAMTKTRIIQTSFRWSLYSI